MADALALLVESTLAMSVAILLVLALRSVVRRRFGAGVAYACWLLVPITMLAVLLPAPAAPPLQLLPLQTGFTASADTTPAPQAPLPWREILLALWSAGAVVSGLLLAWQQRAFTKRLGKLQPRPDGLWQAQAVSGLPAVIGVLRSRIVLPADFERRYNADERQLILCHERTHLRRCDLQVNGFAAAMRTLHWFNPLVHAGWRWFRRDQELACDQRVLARHPNARRTYAEALLKTQLTSQSLPVGCHWQGSTLLKERIEMMKRHAPTRMRTLAGAVLVSLSCLAGGYAAWAAQPAAAPLAAEPAYAVQLQLTLGGEVHEVAMDVAENVPFAFVTTTATGEWTGEFTVRRAGPESVMLSASILENGAPVATPRLAFKLGAEANLSIGNGPDTPRLGLGILVTGLPPSPAGAQPRDSTMPGERRTDTAQPGVDGHVVLLVDVAADGRVTDVAVETSRPQGMFDQAAIKAVRHWTFQPTTEQGKPVAGRVRVPIHFGRDASTLPTG